MSTVSLRFEYNPPLWISYSEAKLIFLSHFWEHISVFACHSRCERAAPEDKRYLQGRSGGHRGGGRGCGSNWRTFPRRWIASRIPRGFLGSRRLVLLLLLLLLLLAALGPAIFEPYLWTYTRGAIFIIDVTLLTQHNRAPKAAAPAKSSRALLCRGMNRASIFAWHAARTNARHKTRAFVKLA